MATTSNNSYVTKGTLVYYDTKVKSWTEEKISGAIAGLGNVLTIKERVDNVEALPSNAKVGDVYTVGAADAAEFEEYYWNGTKWEYMGVTRANLDGYVTDVQLYKGAEGTGTAAIPAEGTLLYPLYLTVKTNADNIAALTERVTATETDIDNLEGRVATAENDIDAVEVAINGEGGIAERVTAAEASVNDLDDAINGAGGAIERIAAVEAKVAEEMSTDDIDALFATT